MEAMRELVEAAAKWREDHEGTGAKVTVSPAFASRMGETERLALTVDPDQTTPYIFHEG